MPKCCNCETKWEMYSYYWTAKFVATGEPFDFSQNPPNPPAGSQSCQFQWIWDDSISQRDIITPMTQIKLVLYKGPDGLPSCQCVNSNGGKVVSNNLLNTYPKTWPTITTRKRGHWQGIGPTALCRTLKTRPFSGRAKIQVKKIGVEGLYEVKYSKIHDCGPECDPPAPSDPKINPAPFDIEQTVNQNITNAQYP